MWIFIYIDVWIFFIKFASINLLYFIISLNIFPEMLLFLTIFLILEYKILLTGTYTEKKNPKMYFYDSLLTKAVVFTNNLKGMG